MQKLLRVDPGELRSVEGPSMLALGGTPVPVAALADDARPARPRDPAAPDGKTPAVVVAGGDQLLAFVVDDFVGEQEVVVKGLGPRVRRLPHVSGATILPSGRIAPVLNAANLVRAALQTASAATLAAPAAQRGSARQETASWSSTTRSRRARWRRAFSKPPATTWRWPPMAPRPGSLLQTQGADLLVSDVEMPRMDGFALTETVPQLAALPRACRWSWSPPARPRTDRARGIAVRADAYLAKSGFDQKNLLATIGQLL